jgi:four helix bundle protein
VEVETEALPARDLGYLNAEQSEALLAKATELGKILNGLINSIRQVA